MSRSERECGYGTNAASPARFAAVVHAFTCIESQSKLYARCEIIEYVGCAVKTIFILIVGCAFFLEIVGLTPCEHCEQVGAEVVA